MRYFSFDGRLTRSEYWITMISMYILAIVTFMISFGMALSETNPALSLIGLTLIVIIAFACFISSISIAWRRCRDIGIHPAWSFTIIAPYISFIAFVIIGIIPTDNLAKKEVENASGE